MSYSIWETVKLETVTSKIGSGSTPRGGANSYKLEGIPFIRSKNIYNCKFSKGGIVYIDSEQARKLNNVEVFNDDVLLNITGDSVARCTKVPNNYIGARVNQHVAIIRTNEVKLNSDFLKYYLVSPFMQSFMLSIARSGGTRAALTKSMIEAFEIPLPTIKEQKAIGDILYALDEKIETNNQISKKLEDMAQAIFKRWFVDFEFLDENGVPYKLSNGKMVESEMGLIPKGWEVKTLEQCCNEIVRGFTSKYIPNGEIKNLNQRVNKGEYLEKQYFKYLSEDIDVPNNKYLRKHDILVNSLGQGTLGRIHYYIEEEQNIVVDQHITIIRSNNNILQTPYVHQMLITPRYKEMFNGLITGSTGMLMLNISKIRNIKMCIPPLILQENYSVRVESLYSKKAALLKENENLSEIRDALLPKIMSGEIRVPI